MDTLTDVDPQKIFFEYSTEWRRDNPDQSRSDRFRSSRTSGQGALLPGISSSRTFVLSCCTLLFEGLALMYRYIRALRL